MTVLAQCNSRGHFGTNTARFGYPLWVIFGSSRAWGIGSPSV